LAGEFTNGGRKNNNQKISNKKIITKGGGEKLKNHLKVNSKIFFFALNSNEVKLFFSNLGTSKKSNSAFMLTLLFKKSEVFN
jgi:hypothetical protein